MTAPKLNRPPQPDDWKTPDDFYNKLNKRFNFDFDLCPLNHNINDWDGLEVEWGQRNFVNPPYSRKLKEAFIIKAYKESLKGKLCVLLIPASTDTIIFHEYILDIAEIEFIKGRIKFEGFNNRGEYCNYPAQKGSMLVIYNLKKKQDAII